MTPEWAGPDFGDESEMGAVAPIVFDGTAEDATTRLHNRRPKASQRQIAILVRRARQKRNAGQVSDMSDAIHDLAVLGIRSMHARPAETPRHHRANAVAWLLLVLCTAMLLTACVVWRNG